MTDNIRDSVQDVVKASAQLEFRAMYAAIMAFDVPVDPEAMQVRESDLVPLLSAPSDCFRVSQMAEKVGVKIFTADIIYHLFDQFTAYLQELHEQAKEAAAEKVVFPCRLKVGSFSAARSCSIEFSPKIAAFSDHARVRHQSQGPDHHGRRNRGWATKNGHSHLRSSERGASSRTRALVSRFCVVDCASAPVPDAGPHRFDRGG